MKKFAITLFIVSLFTISVTAQKADDKTAVLGVVQALFDAMRAADAAAILATGTADNSLVAIQKGKDGKSKVSVISADAFTKFFTKPNAVKEVMYDHKVAIDGDWAQVYGRYVFFVGDKISHCGINQFNLVRTDAGWKIANGASTMDPSACNEKEKAMKP
ncbi:MAG TPA: hypothetical protein PKA82_00740 [Pyrinomonadaceae bacterium]|nr:hypothetical protein [Pyrinomonadaceae bacterium]